MKMLPIVQAPNPVLFKKARCVGKLTPKILGLIDDMKSTLILQTSPKGVGLAAPQVGKSLQIFVVLDEGLEFIPIEQAVNGVTIRKVRHKRNPYKVFINPEVYKYPSQKTSDPTSLEGCLSLLGVWGNVKRFAKVRVKWMDEKGKIHRKIFTNFTATIIQHEYDHLQGKLFPDNIENCEEVLKDKTGEDGMKYFQSLTHSELTNLGLGHKIINVT